MPEILDWARDLLMSRGALVETEESNSLRAMLPPELAAALDASDWLSLRLLAWSGAIYLGASLAKGEFPWLGAELAVSLGVLVLAWLGLWGSPKWLAAGYGLRALWDAGHDRGLVKTPVMPWLPPVSAAFDVVVAAWILWRL